MTGNAINTNIEALELHELCSEELDAASGGFAALPLLAFHLPRAGGQTGGQTGQNDPAQMFQQIMQQLTQGG